MTSTNLKRKFDKVDEDEDEDFVFNPTPNGPYAFTPFLLKRSPRALTLLNKIIGRNESNKIKKEDIPDDFDELTEKKIFLMIRITTG